MDKDNRENKIFKVNSQGLSKDSKDPMEGLVRLGGRRIVEPPIEPQREVSKKPSKEPKKTKKPKKDKRKIPQKIPPKAPEKLREPYFTHDVPKNKTVPKAVRIEQSTDFEYVKAGKDIFSGKKNKKISSSDIKEKNVTRKPQIPQKQQKPVSTKNRIIKICVCFFIMVAVIIMAIAVTSNNDSIKTDYVTVGAIDNNFDAKVYYFRNEICISAPSDGTVVPKINEGARVQSGDVIAYIVTPDKKDIFEQMREVESKMIIAETASSQTTSLIEDDLTLINNEISDISTKLAIMSMNGNLLDYDDCQKQLELLFERKNDLIMNVDTQDEYLIRLQSEYAGLKTQLSGSMYEVIATCAGVISYCLDGQETYVSGLSSDNFTTNTFEMLNNNGTSSVNKVVKAGNQIVKIAPDFEYNIAMSVSAKNASLLKIGNVVTVKSKDRKVNAAAEVVQIKTDAEGKIIAILKSSSALSGSLAFRSQEANISLSYYEGLMVPIRSLTEFDAAGVTARITMVRYNYVEYVYVNIIAKNDSYAIITGSTIFDDDTVTESPVKANDIFIVNYEDVYEGQVIN